MVEALQILPFARPLRRCGLIAGIVIIFAVGVFYFIYCLDDDAGLHSQSYLRGRGLGMVFLAGMCGLWSIVRGVIYLIRAQSGDEHYAKGVEDMLDKQEEKIGQKMGKKMGNASMFNVLVLLVWVFLFLAVVAIVGLGYLWLFPYDKYK